jgi:hypothetical protein
MSPSATRPYPLLQLGLVSLLLLPATGAAAADSFYLLAGADYQMIHQTAETAAVKVADSTHNKNGSLGVGFERRWGSLVSSSLAQGQFGILTPDRRYQGFSLTSGLEENHARHPYQLSLGASIRKDERSGSSLSLREQLERQQRLGSVAPADVRHLNEAVTINKSAALDATGSYFFSPHESFKQHYETELEQNTTLSPAANRRFLWLKGADLSFNKPLLPRLNFIAGVSYGDLFGNEEMSGDTAGEKSKFSEVKRSGSLKLEKLWNERIKTTLSLSAGASSFSTASSEQRIGLGFAADYHLTPHDLLKTGVTFSKSRSGNSGNLDVFGDASFEKQFSEKTKALISYSKRESSLKESFRVYKNSRIATMTSLTSVEENKIYVAHSLRMLELTGSLGSSNYRTTDEKGRIHQQDASVALSTMLDAKNRLSLGTASYLWRENRENFAEVNWKGRAYQASWLYDLKPALKASGSSFLEIKTVRELGTETITAIKTKFARDLVVASAALRY